jgi:16S rRNA G1207 methylase RsmC
VLPTLKRYPERKNDLLQAWDSADTLILEHLNGIPLDGKRILIVNDAFGALSCALVGLNFTVYTDSYLSAQAIRLNSEKPVSMIHRLNDMTGIYDFVLFKVPKNMSFFEDTLAHLSAHLRPYSKIICGYRVKHTSKTAFDLLARYIGPTTTSLAQKKARLIFADFQKKEVSSTYPHQVLIEGFEKPFVNHSNLFSREKLDIGTRFLLEHIPQANYRSILDLGCGNAIIGIAAKQLNPGAKLIFTDESMMAIESAQANYSAYFKDEAQFLWTHGCKAVRDQSVDLALCNPPFHQETTVGDFTAWQMFMDARRVLLPNGRFRVIGNSHLQYQISLKKIFGNFEIIEKNSKFTIIDSINH